MENKLISYPAHELREGFYAVKIDIEINGENFLHAKVYGDTKEGAETNAKNIVDTKIVADKLSKLVEVAKRAEVVLRGSSDEINRNALANKLAEAAK